MKGIILAGGLGTRLRPLTHVTNKHLLPVYDRPMVMYPLATLRQAGISEIMVVCGKEHAGGFMNFLGSGKDFDVKLSYALQQSSGGIAEALSLAEDFADGGKMAVILGDNIFEDDFSSAIKVFERRSGAMVFLKQVPDANRFGVAEVEGDNIVRVEEKPAVPKSDLAITGLYLYDPDVFSKIRTLHPSARNELEITDVQNLYLQERKLSFAMVDGFWSDAGTFESLLRAAQWAAERKKR
ncbi:MAG TPA: sugar phosphate nucleotidyltransferase [Candidatus Paceibacterota bacterium]|nr:sugar phosphate nucleotidyltransferase [Candidatus Paceibacterota bacterium]